jgi:hypothetical protein
MRDITQKIIEKKYNKLEIGDYFIITKGIIYCCFGDNCNNFSNIVTEISQGKNGLYIGWLSLQNNIMSTEKFTSVDENIVQLDYYHNIRKNIYINDYENTEKWKVGDKFIFVALSSGWKIISNNFDEFYNNINKDYSEKKNITHSQNDISPDLPIYDISYYSEINKEYIPKIYHIKIINENPEKIAESIFTEILEITFNKIEKKMIKRRILEDEVMKEIEKETEIDFLIKNFLKNEFENRTKVEENEEKERKIYDERAKEIEKIKNKEKKENILETIKQQTLDLLNLYNLYNNDDNNIMLKKTIIEMVNKLKPKYIDLKLKEEKIMENIPDLKIEKVYVTETENNTENNSNQMILSTNHYSRQEEEIIKFELNNKREIIVSDKYDKYNKLNLAENNPNFILSVKSAKIWMVGGGCGGNLIFGGNGGKNAFYKIDTENKIHIENVGRGGSSGNFGEETKIFLENDNKILSVAGGDSYTKNEIGGKVNCSSGIIGGNGGNKNESGGDGFVFIKYKN